MLDMFAKVETFAVPCQHIREYPYEKSDQVWRELSLSVKRYVPSRRPHLAKKRVTVIAAGGNGFPKVS